MPTNLTPEVLGIAREAFRRGIEQAVYTTYHAGQNAVWAYWMRTAFALSADRAVLRQALAGVSALEHILGDRATMPADAGLLLDKTWRMHPALCRFTSEVFYDGKLTGVPGLDRQQILADVIRAIHDGKTPTTPEHAFWLGRDDRPRRPKLSPREREILVAVGNGTPHKAIARQLGITMSTVQTHLERVRYKYASVGRPIDHAAHYSERVREDNLGRERLPSPPNSNPHPHPHP